MNLRNNKSKISRRSFIASAAALAAAPMFIPARALGRDGNVAPSERITVAVLGTGGRGSGHSHSLIGDPSVQFMAACDAQKPKAEAIAKAADAKYAADIGAGKYKGCTVHQDFREVIARDDIDAVFIASPENWHAIMSIESMKAGKDVYCEKALSLTVREGRAVCDTVRRYGRVFQAGTQQRSDRNFRHACELARNGYLGKVHTVTVSVPGGNKLPILPVRPVPEGIDYDMWLGPAPYKPYREGLCSFNWYFVSDYCAGWIQSWGVHHADIALWGMPSIHSSTMEVEGEATFPDEGTADCSYEWKTQHTMPDGLKLVFCSDGSKSVYGHGCRFEGDKGWVHVVRGGIRAEPASLLNVAMKPGEEHLVRSNNHQSNFLECIRTRRDPAAPVEACHLATTLTLVADVATRLKRKVKWDWKNEQFIGDETANRMLSRSMRAPWRV
jgi:predicted dehydrogenase